MIMYRELFFRRPAAGIAIFMVLLSLCFTTFFQSAHRFSARCEMQDVAVKVEQQGAKYKIWGRYTLVEGYGMDVCAGELFVVQGDFKDVLLMKNLSYGRYLKAQGIHYIVKSPIVRKTGQIQSWYFWRGKILMTVEKKIDRIYRREGYFWKALFYGDRQEFPKEIKEDFSKAGISHVLALSGFHVGIIALFLQLALQMLSLKKRNTFICIFLVFYALLTGARPSILRAVGFYVLYYLSFLWCKRYDLISSLGVLCVVILFFNPWRVWDIGFQLSFLSVLSIAMFYPKWRRFFETQKSRIKIYVSLPKVGKGGIDILFGMVGVTVCVQILTLPLSVLYFKTVPLYSVLCNLITLPLVTLSMLLFLPSLCLPANFFVTKALAWGADGLMKQLLLRISQIVLLPKSHLQIQMPSALFILLLYGFCFAWYFIEEKKRIKENFYAIQGAEKTGKTAG